MDSINPLNILKLLQMDYEQDFQPNDSPSDHDELLKALIKTSWIFISTKLEVRSWPSRTIFSTSYRSVCRRSNSSKSLSQKTTC
ncbi:hypothetical protein RvY_13181 [Ramazzottius varieornatus]|uniref:Uncharacterized protein n=1 Tax=Ramazzottius varieornatus TaxID=947166 RepID=A0A1D1VM02_RAMVA|nr:hypothetical protein RvY_13181 [Ramazzottius varieornatus]